VIEESLYVWADPASKADPRLELGALGIGDTKLEKGKRFAWLPGDGLLNPVTVAAVRVGQEDWQRIWPALLGDQTGPELRFLAQATRFALRLVEEKCVLPGATIAPDGIEGRWVPVYLGAHRATFEALLAVMPESLRALSAAKNKVPTLSRRKLLEVWMNGLADHLMRGAARTTLQKRVPLGMPHGKWFHALAQPSAYLIGDRVTAERIQRAVANWMRPIDLDAVDSYRIHFEIYDPADPLAIVPMWRVDPQLEDLLADGDPPLRMRLVDVWRRDGGLELRNDDSVRHNLHTAVSRAEQVFPPLRQVDYDAGGDLLLDGDQISLFLSKHAPLLEAAGFGIGYPAWWKQAAEDRVTVAGTLVPETEADVEDVVANSGDGATLPPLSGQVRLDWQAILGGEVLTYRQLVDLGQQSGAIRYLDGEWTRVHEGSVREAVRFLKKGMQQRIGAREALRLSLGLGRAARGVDIRKIDAHGWLGDLVRKLSEPRDIKNLPIPEGLNGELRPYQVRGYSWLHFLTQFGLGACLADDMGLGKTIQTLTLLARIHTERGGGTRPSLLVCPTSVVGNWQRETQRFFPKLKLMVHHGADRRKGKSFAQEALEHDIVVTTYSLIHRDIDQLREVPWDGVILDEAQNIKNSTTKQSQSARAIDSAWRIALTGTPVENHVLDLHSLMEFLNAGFLGTERDFRERFYKPIQTEQDTRAAEQLKRITAPFILRRLKTDRSIISDLPEKMEMKVYCKLTREQTRLYQQVVDGFTQDVEGRTTMERRGLILATISKLKQVCNHPAQYLKKGDALRNRSGKLSRITEMLEEVLESGEKALVFSQFSEMGELLVRHFQETLRGGVCFLHGGTPRAERERLIERFSATDGPGIFVLSLKAGGTGLNLTAANHVFHFDRWWNPAVENQATDRAYRIGQSKKVQVHKFVCMGTLEERIDQMVDQKREIAERVVEVGETWLTELSNQELRDLFALSREAFEDADE
jgi:superfamily II DNA or RNA helicase